MSVPDEISELSDEELLDLQRRLSDELARRLEDDED
ncbi:hypothetical protein CLV72_101206 [Allonocardiopsis opalescens]|uniref:Uncharacterized protein n=1 Tax=Allonocardiopsis opalescens TaxID=1144618 RepID=A0A2T0QCP2_9ACTN|nr:hypothetical protein CLV72_101206 [Allonocardiopsis opalescens]